MYIGNFYDILVDFNIQRIFQRTSHFYAFYFISFCDKNKLAILWYCLKTFDWITIWFICYFSMLGLLIQKFKIRNWVDRIEHFHNWSSFKSIFDTLEQKQSWSYLLENKYEAHAWGRCRREAKRATVTRSTKKSAHLQKVN